MTFSFRRLFFVFAFSFLLILVTVTPAAPVRPGDDEAKTKKFNSQKDDGPILMTRDEISKVAGEALANATAKKLNILNDTQLEGVGESLARSKNSTAVVAVMRKLTKVKALKLVAKMANSLKKLSRRIQANLMKEIKKKFGDDLSTISKDDIKRLGPKVLQQVSKDDIKKLIKKRDAFDALSEELAKSQDLRDSKRKAIAEGAKTLHGNPNTWDKDIVGKYGGFARPADLDKISPNAIKGALDQLAKNMGIKRVNARKILSKLGESNGLGRPGNWNATTLKRLGGLAKALKPSHIKEMDPTALKDSLAVLGKLDLSKSQARAVIEKIVASKPANQWLSDDLKKAGKLIIGFSRGNLTKLSRAVINESLRELGSVSRELTTEQKREIAKKIDKPSVWTNRGAKKISNLCYGKSSKELKNIGAYVAKELVAAMTPERHAPEAKNRVLKKKIFSTGNVNLTITGAVISSMTLNDLKNANPKRELGLDQPDQPAEEKKDLPWNPALVRQLIDNFKEQEGQPDTWTEKVVSFLVSRGLLTGCSTEDISKIRHLPLEDLADVSDRLLPAQRQAVMKKFKEDKEIKTPTDCSKLTRPDIEALGVLAGDFSNEELENLQQDAALDAVSKIGEDTKLGKKPRELIRRTLDIALKKLGRGSIEEVIEDDILVLGNLVCGLSPEQIAKIPMATFNATKYNIGERTCFSSEQLKTLAKKAKESIEVDKMTSDDVLDLGTIVEGLTADDLRKMRDTVVQEIKDAFGNFKLSSEKAKVLMEKLAKRVTRRRRNTDVSTKNGQELVAMGNMLLGLTSSDIATVNIVAFDDAVSTIGKIDGFSREQLEAWADKAKKAWNSDVAKFKEDQLLRLGAIAIGFTDSELEKMALSSDDVIESLGSQNVKSAEAHGYTLSQLSKALNGIKTLKRKSIDKFTGAEISNLNNFSLALTVEEIGSIPKETFINCIGSLGKTNGWSADQMNKLKEKAVEAHGPVSGWSPAKLSESGRTIGGFTKSELQSLSGEHVSVITPEAIRSMPPSLFAGFTETQLQHLDYNQAAAVTNEQMQALPENLRNILKVKTGSIKPDSSGGAQTYISQVLNIAIILTTVIVINN
ncbi:uncharacterized protein LOC116305230 [Actinia tenebrosa]|uniref:Uncharacterized protein LOC116305230 n=1 Tax=Actinia tenebrosa TaxID=6105 RepID=A0A6P8IUI6_ACTTE|nr:uncharacterized protein LOC116305230 [Actinia tenebrosa]